jgi:hypothetical protein
METLHFSSKPQTILTQTENNTTLWIGHLQNDPTDHFAGQTFICPADGLLDNIQLFADTVPYAGETELSFHEFDKNYQNWGPPVGQCSLYVNQTDHNKWIRFILPALQLKKGTTYGFRIHSDKAMIGFGEAAHDTQHPFSFGHEWHGSSDNEKGNYYSYFSLMFKVETRA